MNFDFTPNPNSLYIPKDVYRPIKRCSSCQSVYLTDTHCETCGKAIDFNLLGAPFSVKSFYRIREKYWNEQSFIVQMYPFFEDFSGSACTSYKRNLMKRFKDLIHCFSTPNQMAVDDRSAFYLELKNLVNEMLEYHFSPALLTEVVFNISDKEYFSQDMINYINQQSLILKPHLSWPQKVLHHRFYQVFRVEFILKFSIVLAAIIFTAVRFKFLVFNSLIGK